MAAKNNIILFMAFPYGNLRWGMPTELKGGRVYNFIVGNTMVKMILKQQLHPFLAVQYGF